MKATIAAVLDKLRWLHYFIRTNRPGDELDRDAITHVMACN